MPLVCMLFVQVCLYFFPVSLLAVSIVNLVESVITKIIRLDLAIHKSLN